MPDIEITAVVYGETVITVDEDEYYAAKTEGKLDHFLDWQLSDIDTETKLIEPNGKTIYPYEG